MARGTREGLGLGTWWNDASVEGSRDGTGERRTPTDCPSQTTMRQRLMATLTDLPIEGDRALPNIGTTTNGRKHGFLYRVTL